MKKEEKEREHSKKGEKDQKDQKDVKGGINLTEEEKELAKNLPKDENFWKEMIIEEAKKGRKLK